MPEWDQLLVEVVGGTVVVVLLALATGIWRSGRNAIDRQKIIEFLKRMRLERGFDFVSTHAIASDTKLSPSRIERLCQTHSGIRRNQKDRESWTLVD
jgi:hypothetical protein